MKLIPSLRQRQSQHEEVGGITDSAIPEIEKVGETLTPNLRALRLAMTASDLLLSMGVPANAVVSKALDITETYCERPVHMDISSNLIMLSQLRGIEYEPLTLMRPVSMRDINNMTVQLVQRLIFHIREGHYDLKRAEKELENILKEPIVYPGWLISVGNGLIAAAVTLMFSTNWRVILVTFIIGVTVDRLLLYLARHSIPPFFRQICATAAITLSAALINLLSKNGVRFFDGMNPTLIVVGGIVMLVAGLTIVGAIQDAIEEYYITANARLLKVIFQTTGIVIGILIGLYTARKLGIGITVSPDPLHLTALQFQVIGAAIAAAGYALVTQTRLRAILWAGIVGGGALAITCLASYLDISIIAASGVAAIFVGVVGSLFSRMWQTPSTGIISAAIIPLVPGLSLYNGLMQLVNYPPGTPLFFSGVGTLFTAISTALAIATGASFGIILGRPIRQKLVSARNVAPFTNFMSLQLRADQRLKLAYLAIRRPSTPFDISLNNDDHQK